MVKVIRGKKGWLTVQALREGYAEEAAGIDAGGRIWTMDLRWNGAVFVVRASIEEQLIRYVEFTHSSEARKMFTTIQTWLRDQSTNT